MTGGDYLAIYQCEFKLVDMYGSTNVKNIFYEQLETAMRKNQSWCPEIVLYGNTEETCVEVFYYNGTIDEISVRINVANVTVEVFNSIISFIKDNNLYIYYDGNIISATKENLINFVTSSPAFRFLKNNKRFLEEIKKDNNTGDNNTGDGSVC